MIDPLDGHDLDGFACRCGPTLFRACEDCDPPDLRLAARADFPPGASPVLAVGCWKCTLGIIPITGDEATALRTEGDSVVVIHQPLKP
jgi:hypothetical protein